MLMTEELRFKSKEEKTEEATVALFSKVKIQRIFEEKPANKKKYKSRGKNNLHMWNAEPQDKRL